MANRAERPLHDEENAQNHAKGTNRFPQRFAADEILKVVSITAYCWRFLTIQVTSLVKA